MPLIVACIEMRLNEIGRQYRMMEQIGEPIEMPKEVYLLLDLLDGIEGTVTIEEGY